MIRIEVIGQDAKVKASIKGKAEAVLVYQATYEEGDKIALSVDDAQIHLVVQLEDSIAPQLLYMRGAPYELPVPFGEKRDGYSPKSFSGGIHVLRAFLASDEQIKAYRNLAINPLDHHGNEGLFPHVVANAETRGEAQFFARNVIDGHCANDAHGPWPYQSWGIDARKDAKLRIEFGRTVRVDKAVLLLRADWPHDSWWREVKLSFSDGTQLSLPMEKISAPQVMSFPARAVEWVELGDLVKADDESSFPALSQIEIWGCEV